MVSYNAHVAPGGGRVVGVWGGGGRVLLGVCGKGWGGGGGGISWSRECGRATGLNGSVNQWWEGSLGLGQESPEILQGYLPGGFRSNTNLAHLILRIRSDKCGGTTNQQAGSSPGTVGDPWCRE